MILKFNLGDNFEKTVHSYYRFTKSLTKNLKIQTIFNEPLTNVNFNIQSIF